MPKSVGFCNVHVLDKVICRNSSFTFHAFVKENKLDILPPFQEGFLVHPAFRKTVPCCCICLILHAYFPFILICTRESLRRLRVRLRASN